MEDETNSVHFPGMVVGVQLWSQSLMLSPSVVDSRSVLWGKDEGNTGQSHPITICGSQGFPHFVASDHWPCGTGFQEIKNKKGRGLAFVEPRSVSSYFFSYPYL